MCTQSRRQVALWHLPWASRHAPRMSESTHSTRSRSPGRHLFLRWLCALFLGVFAPLYIVIILLATMAGFLQATPTLDIPALLVCLFLTIMFMPVAFLSYWLGAGIVTYARFRTFFCLVFLVIMAMAHYYSAASLPSLAAQIPSITASSWAILYSLVMFGSVFTIFALLLCLLWLRDRR